MNELNEKVKLALAPSPIHGIGVFALRDIKEGERCYADDFPKLYEDIDLNALRPEVRKAIVEHQPYALYSKFAYPWIRYQAYMNHSDNPNFEDDIALRDIKAGEELTENYRRFKGWQIAFPWLSTSP